ncbi:MAG: hypothetical protein GYB66_07480 [Chloroflexi bacterium]|nr:hypothetical protein [Chloroflexota bacterium]
MSKVVSFRLDEEVPEEQQALAVLEAWQQKGYSTRAIMTWALMALAGADPTGPSETTGEPISELRSVLNQAQGFLEALQKINAVPAEVEVEGEPKPVLTEVFLASVRKAARPGMTLED